MTQEIEKRVTFIQLKAYLGCSKNSDELRTAETFMSVLHLIFGPCGGILQMLIWF